MDRLRIPSTVTDRIRPHAKETLAKLKTFVEHDCVPADDVFESQLGSNPEERARTIPPILGDLKKKARELGLWNLWLHSHYEDGAGFTNLEYGLMCETMGRSRIAPEATNCSAPDTGNMEVLAKHGTKEQKERWLQPLLEGEIRSSFVMTERQQASSYAKNVSMSMRREGGEYVLNGTLTMGIRWIVFAKSNPEEPDENKQHSVILVSPQSPGVTILRNLHVYGFDGKLPASMQHKHSS
ncbi:hypothetical protein LTR10_015272 [Elasticomyces elasticus]|uniref:Acyl-CoA dehydrogenase/oxidase N-terminal domain-containing protein n=1 Tax=Exophiala sideris TaxID=1016849 RepID=A0ABR0JE86_9EURO|nr:hypothetical protein LTR10_015272 [Elasticomyces elasticus]KAK5032747.1 hypothetical protein LTS07_004157 [Exophiala sideris]KAK5037073.1 hypothetical protein LTR13_004878 [Exophiala sideris]KAK5062271.1 hypothetical protein LTR69_004629 [Exophiala sideris]KAK5182231.1 hypothetical protein LTR44_005242 [Eurotiomycetes sp. CCFEE 6388]